MGDQNDYGAHAVNEANAFIDFLGKKIGEMKQNAISAKEVFIKQGGTAFVGMSYVRGKRDACDEILSLWKER